MLTLNLLVEATLRGTLLIAAAYSLSLLLRRIPAVIHHRLWLLTLTAVLVMPCWLVISPSWSTSLLGQTGKTDTSAVRFPAQYFSLETHPVVQPSQVGSQISSTAGGQALASSSDAEENRSLRQDDHRAAAPYQTSAAHLSRIQVVVMLWLVGAVFCLGYWLREQISIILLARRGTPLTDHEWVTTARTVAASLNLKQRVILITSSQITIPMAWGFWRPVILLPADVHTWTPQLRQVVLTHELVHIKRGDTLTQWIGLLSCAANWFNPCVWWALRRLSVECERACDDRVVSLGIPATEYVGHLVGMARSVLCLPSSIQALSRKSELSVRVRSILNSRARHCSLSWKRSFTVMLSYFALVMLPLSTFTPGLIQRRLAQGEQDEITLILAVPEYISDYFDTSWLDDFEDTHPGIHVVLNTEENLMVMSQPFTGDYFDEVEQCANTGDVLLISGTQVNPASTLPGYFLDLAPLVNADPTLNVDDFFPAAWQSFQWDGGIWGLPTHWNLAVMSYSPPAFDAAGLTYPSSDWTLDDLTTAARLLTTGDTYGLEVVPWLRDFPLLSSLFGESMIETTVPGQPNFNNPALAALLEQWNQFLDENLISPVVFPDAFWPDGRPLEQIANAEAPMMISTLAYLESTNTRQIVPLPGGHASAVQVGGVAISAGTQHPEGAYELAKYLTTRPETFGVWGSLAAPTRQSLFHSGANNFPVNLQPMFENLAANAIPFSETRYAVYIAHAIGQVSRSDIAQVLQSYDVGSSMTDKLNVLAALALSDQETALARRGTFILTLPVPVPVEIPSGEIAIRFGMQSFIQPLPNQAHWDQIIASFAASDPDVGYVDLAVFRDFGDYATDYDCFYVPVTLTAFDAVGLLDLTPLMNADPAFDPNDFLPGVLDFTRSDSRTFGYPLSIQPHVLTYSANGFQQAGVPLPVNGWTIGDFVATLEALKAVTGEAAMDTNFGVPEHLFILIQAFGGMPIDSRVSPPAADFTSSQNVEAIRSVLELIRQGYITYRSVDNPENGINIPENPLLTTSYIDPRVGGVSNNGGSFVFYPVGVVTPVSIGVGTAYISQQAANPEACYRWISTLSQNPDLLNAMPARTSGINDPRLLATQGDSAIQVYQQIDTLMRTPGTLVSRTAFGGEAAEAYYLKYWLSKAFDAYILNNTPLEDALADAQIKANAYLGCAAQILLDPSRFSEAYYQAHHECVTKADPAYPY